MPDAARATTVNTPLDAIVALMLDAATHGGHPVTHKETPLSHIFLVGDVAYKLKKPIRFDFVDYSTLDQRQYYCELELTLNQRFAPELYLGLLPIQQTAGGLVLGDAGGETVEYVIKMKRFDEAELFSNLLAANLLESRQLSSLTDSLVQATTELPAEPAAWQPELVQQLAASAVAGLAGFPEIIPPEVAASLETRVMTEAAKLADLMAIRQRQHVQRGHGDLHLGNICWFEGRALMFDALEFSAELATTDILAELAFITMDLAAHEREDLATLVLNRYLKRSDDFAGLPLLSFYEAYRAIIRARVCCLQQLDTTALERRRLTAEALRYAIFAQRRLAPAPNAPLRIIAIGGLSGSGKSTLGRALAESIGAVHVRSDAVRKHLLGIPVYERCPPEGYSEEHSLKTYAGLLERAEAVLATGRPVVLDAVYHREEQREEVAAFAHAKGVPFTGLWCSVPHDVARQRIGTRRGDISDAGMTPESIEWFEKMLITDMGRISWHRLDTLYGVDQVLQRVMSVLELAAHS